MVLYWQYDIPPLHTPTGFSSNRPGWLSRLETCNCWYLTLLRYTTNYNIKHDGTNSPETGKTLFCWWVLPKFIKISISFNQGLYLTQSLVLISFLFPQNSRGFPHLQVCDSKILKMWLLKQGKKWRLFYILILNTCIRLYVVYML